MATEEVPFYPEVPCHLAPLRRAVAPEFDCDCAVCKWALRRMSNANALDTATYPIRPGTREWAALLEASK